MDVKSLLSNSSNINLSRFLMNCSNLKAKKLSFAIITILLITFFQNIELTSQVVEAPKVKEYYRQLNGSRFYNRPLGYPNDATSISYNPSMLGLRGKDAELVFVLPYTDVDVDSLSYTNKVWGTFAKISGFGIGWLAGNDITPSEIYAGFGIPIKGQSLYWGFSATATKYKDKDLDFGDMRFNTSLLFAPHQRFLFSGGASNMHALDSRYYLLYAQGVYSPLDWLSLHYEAKYSDAFYFENAHMGGKDVFMNAGINLSLFEDLAISTMYSPSTENIRIGFEWGTGIGIGAFTDSKSSKGVNSSADFLLRFSSDEYLSQSDLAERGSLIALRDECFPGAYNWQLIDDKLMPSELFSKMRFLGGDYTKFVEELTKISPVENDVFTNIAKNYYPLSYIPQTDTTLKLSNLIKSKNKHTVYQEKATRINDNETSLILKVKDVTSSNVAGLKKENFSILDTNYLITRLEETNSEKKLPVDIVFLVDASGSMSEEIASIKRNIDNFAAQLENRGVDSKLGGMLFGNTILRTIKLTSNLSQYRNDIAKFNYDNNAFAECTSIAIQEASEMDFRTNAEKIIIVVTDECMLQTSGDFNEFDLTQMLWKKGIKLYSMINFAGHNGGFVTKFTLGKGYDIRTPFNEILDKIAGDVSTTYELIYSPKPKEIPKVIPKFTAITGEVRDTEGWKVATEINFKSQSGKSIKVKTNAISGRYFTLIPEGESYQAEINLSKYVPLNETVNLTQTTKGDTLTKDFVLQVPNSKLSGIVFDENKNPTTAEVFIKDVLSGEVRSIKTNDKGYYENEIEVGKLYSLSAKKQEYINIAVEFDIRNRVKGENFVQDLQVVEVLAAIEKGLTFKVNNILFDSGKWDIKPASAIELDKLVEFLKEYPNLRVEIGAHTDDVGRDDANMTLSSNRAASVVQYLVSKTIDGTRLTSKGYGETVPVGDNTTPEGKAINRRVEFKLIK